MPGADARAGTRGEEGGRMGGRGEDGTAWSMWRTLPAIDTAQVTAGVKL